MGNVQCGNGEDDVSDRMESTLYMVNYNNASGGREKFRSKDIIGMTPKEACEHISDKASDEKIYYIHVVKRNGELQEETKIVNRKGLGVKTVGGVITKVYTEDFPIRKTGEK